MFRLDEKTTSLEFLNLIKYQLIHLNSFVFGALVLHNYSPQKSRKEYIKHKFQTRINIKFGDPKKILKIAIIMTLVVIMIYTFVSGKSMFIRDVYLPKGDSKILTLMAKLLSIVAVFILGLSHRSHAFQSYLMFFVILILNLSTGSRFTFILLMVYVLLLYNTSKRSLIKNLLFIIKLVLCFFFLAYLIQLRKLDNHGLIPYLGYVFDSFDKIFDFFVFNIYYMFIFGNFVTVDTIDRGLSNWTTIAISVNPLPGSMVGWYDYASNLRINKYCPYSSHGEVFTIGSFFTFCYYFVIGIVVTYLDFSFRKKLYNKKIFIAVFILLFVALHLIYGFEYNLRSSIRYLYYILFILLVINTIKITFRYFKTQVK